MVSIDEFSVSWDVQLQLGLGKARLPYGDASQGKMHQETNVDGCLHTRVLSTDATEEIQSDPSGAESEELDKRSTAVAGPALPSKRSYGSWRHVPQSLTSRMLCDGCSSTGVRYSR